MIDSKIGPYRVIRLIGQGGQGSVYLGYDDRLERPVAIKIYLLPSDKKRRRALLAEARAVAGMQGPQVVQIYDVIESETHLGMVMEYVAGCTLEEFLRAAQPSLASAITVAQDLAAALTLARQRGIVHGDLKGANVLITPQGHAKLVDFGIARQDKSEFPRGFAAGSMSALSPEQYRGEQLTHRSDLFSLGILLYRMLGGAHPFYRDGRFNGPLLLAGGERPLAELTADCEEVAEGVTDELLQLVHALLRTDPAERVGSTLRVRQVLLDVSRTLPAVQADSLLRETASLLRRDAAADLPEKVPGGFEQRARRHFIAPGGRIERLWHWLRYSPWRQRLLAGGVACIVLATPVALVRHFSVTVVQFEQPVLRISESPLVRKVDSRWLLRQVKTVMQDSLGALDVIGTVDPEALQRVYSPRAFALRPTTPDERYRVELHCEKGVCAFMANRRGRNLLSSEHTMLFADLPEADLRELVLRSARGLFD